MKTVKERFEMVLALGLCNHDFFDESASLEPGANCTAFRASGYVRRDDTQPECYIRRVVFLT